MEISDILKLTSGSDDKDIDKLISELRKQKKDYVSWKDANKIVEEWNIPAKGWFKLLLAENIDRKEKFLRLYRRRQSLNIYTDKEFIGILNSLKLGAKKLNWYEPADADLFTSLDKFKKDNMEDKEKIRKLRKTLQELETQRVQSDIPKFEKGLRNFKKIYSNKHEEEDLQKFLEENTWLFGDVYIDQKPTFFSQFDIWNSKFDFFLERYDGFFDIFEIKKADVKLFIGKREKSTDSPARESPISAELKDGISQMIRYLEDANIFESAILRREGVLIHKPKGYIIIGQDEKGQEARAIKTLNSYLNGIEVLTYDTVYKRGSNFVSKLKKKVKQ